MHADPEDLAERVAGLADAARRVLVGIAGPPGAGKSTLAAAVAEALLRRAVPTVVVPMDGFHLADAALAALGRLDRKGAIDTFDAAGFAALLARLREADEVVWAPAFDRAIEQPIAGSIAVPPHTRVVITEGNYLLVPDGPWARARASLDEAWYLESDEDLRRARLIERHIRFGKAPDRATRWVEQVDERNAALVRDTATAADVRLLLRTGSEG